MCLVYISVCVCVCVSIRAHTHTHTYCGIYLNTIIRAGGASRDNHHASAYELCLIGVCRSLGTSLGVLLLAPVTLFAQALCKLIVTDAVVVVVGGGGRRMTIAVLLLLLAVVMLAVVVSDTRRCQTVWLACGGRVVFASSTAVCWPSASAPMRIFYRPDRQIKKRRSGLLAIIC